MVLLSKMPYFLGPVEKLSSWKSENQMSIAELWIEFFEHFTLGVLSSDSVISIRSTSDPVKDERQWKGKRMAIEDPFSIKRSLTRSVNSSRVLDFIADCFRIAYLYFGTIQTTLGPIVTRIIVPPSSTKDRKKARKTRIANDQVPVGQDHATKSTNELDDIISKLQISSEGSTLPPLAKVLTLEELEKSFIPESNTGPQNSNMEPDYSSEEDDVDDLPHSGESFEAFAQRAGTALTPKQAQKITELVPKNMIYFNFDGDILTAGQSPILVCTVCGNEGHLQTKCPDEQLPEIKERPALSKAYIEMLNHVCSDMMQSRIPSNREMQARENLIKDLTPTVRHTYPNAILTVFGSSVNGFSFAKSDLDISLTFNDHETDEDLDAIEIIEILAEKLKEKSGIWQVEAITSAKVPIIKFANKTPRIECDISLYNILAQENTKMLRTYSSIDSRVKILGYVVKEFAKKCDIGDASRGSLSSYAYILMLIYYMQQVQPPVIPVLQELFDHSVKKPVKIVDGWDAWFYADLQNLQHAWPGLGQNKMSVSELWLGFLDFYSSGFDYARNVVSIRMKKPLTKFEKMWNSPCIAIEDPFDLSHNLGAGISRKSKLDL